MELLVAADRGRRNFTALANARSPAVDPRSRRIRADPYLRVNVSLQRLAELDHDMLSNRLPASFYMSCQWSGSVSLSPCALRSCARRSYRPGLKRLADREIGRTDSIRGANSFTVRLCPTSRPSSRSPIANSPRGCCSARGSFPRTKRCGTRSSRAARRSSPWRCGARISPGKGDPFANILDFIDPKNFLLLPNTSGAINARKRCVSRASPRGGHCRSG